MCCILNVIDTVFYCASNGVKYNGIFNQNFFAISIIKKIEFFKKTLFFNYVILK